MTALILPYRLGLQQRVFPAYRGPFFDALAQASAGGLSVFTGEPMLDEALGMQGELRFAQHVPARNLYLGGGPLLFVWQLGLIDWLERWNPDVLVMDANPRNVSTNVALRWMHAHGRPVIGWGLGAPPLRAAGVLPAPFQRMFADSRRRFLAHFDALISYSKTGAEQFIAAGCPAERVFIAPNAATPRPTQALPERLPEYSLAPGGDRRPVVLFVGRLQPRKRVDALLRACAALPPGLQPHLRIVGDGPARAALEALAREVYPRAEFAGEKHDAGLAPYYASADLFVLPGTGGLAVQQAMSHGLPVVVAEADGTQSDLVRAENGWVLLPNDDEALLRTLADALSDPTRLRRMGQASYRIVAEEVNLEKMVEVFASAVRAVTRDAPVH